MSVSPVQPRQWLACCLLVRVFLLPREEGHSLPQLSLYASCLDMELPVDGRHSELSSFTRGGSQESFPQPPPETGPLSRTLLSSRASIPPGPFLCISRPSLRAEGGRILMDGDEGGGLTSLVEHQVHFPSGRSLHPAACRTPGS
jgi:hypothetical protein